MANTTLVTACVAARQQFPGNCSGAVKSIASQLGYNLPDVTANSLLDYLAVPSNGWLEVDAIHAQQMADAHRLVIAGKKETGKPGHVVAILPGGMQESGGFLATNKKGQTFTARNYGDFPKACSTGGGWIGAESPAEKPKTVRDSWGSNDFTGVRYWLAPSNN